MRILTRAEVFHAIQGAKNLTEDQASTFLNTFCQNHPSIGQTLLSGFPMVIEQQSEQLSHVFMDTCFDIIYVYAHILGDIPENAVTPQWLQHKMKQLENEARTRPQIELQINAQAELLEYIDLVIQDTIEQSNPIERSHVQKAAGILTRNLLFLVTRLFDSIYDELIPDTVH